jgi:hypothetical protein
MSTATLQPARHPSKKLTAREAADYRRRIKALGWSQNEGARQIGKDPGLFSRWLRRQLSSGVIRQLVDARLAETEAKLGGHLQSRAAGGA